MFLCADTSKHNCILFPFSSKRKAALHTARYFDFPSPHVNSVSWRSFCVSLRRCLILLCSFPHVLLGWFLMDETCFLFLSLRGPPAPPAHPSQQPQQWLRGQPEPQPTAAPLRPASDPQPSQGRSAGPLRPLQLATAHSASCKSCQHLELSGTHWIPFLLCHLKLHSEWESFEATWVLFL